MRFVNSIRLIASWRFDFQRRRYRNGDAAGHYASMNPPALALSSGEARRDLLAHAGRVGAGENIDEDPLDRRVPPLLVESAPRQAAIDLPAHEPALPERVEGPDRGHHEREVLIADVGRRSPFVGSWRTANTPSDTPCQ